MRDWKNPDPLSKPRSTLLVLSLTTIVQLAWNRQLTAGKPVSTIVSGPADTVAQVAASAAAVARMPIRCNRVMASSRSPVALRHDRRAPARQFATGQRHNSRLFRLV